MFQDENGQGWPVGQSVPGLSPPEPSIEAHAAPTLLIIGQAERAALLSGWAVRAGLRPVGSISPEAVPDWLHRAAELDHILIDLRDVETARCLNPHLARVLIARFGLASRVTILTSLAQLDGALAMLDCPGTEFLCEPAEVEIITCLVMASLRPAAPSTVMEDTSRESESQRLAQLSEDVRRLAATLERMTSLGGPFAMREPSVHGPDALGRAPDTHGTPSDRLFEQRPNYRAERPEGIGAPTQTEFRALLRARRMREQFLPAELFAEPAWDMILDLMAARLAGKRVSVSSLCIAAAVPPTTALRHIRQLTDMAVFARIDDPADGRRVFIELTETAAQAVIAWVQAVRRNGGLLAGAAR